MLRYIHIKITKSFGLLPQLVLGLLHLLVLLVLLSPEPVTQVVRKLPSIPIILLPQSPKTVLTAFFPLAYIDLINVVFSHDFHIFFERLPQEFVDVFDRMERLHFIPSEADSLPIVETSCEITLVVDCFRGIDPVPIVETAPELPRVAVGSTPPIILVIPELSLVGDDPCCRVFDPKTVLFGSSVLPLEQQPTSLIENCRIPVNGITGDVFSLDQIGSDFPFRQFTQLF